MIDLGIEAQARFGKTRMSLQGVTKYFTSQPSKEQQTVFKRFCQRKENGHKPIQKKWTPSATENDIENILKSKNLKIKSRHLPVRN